MAEADIALAEQALAELALAELAAVGEAKVERVEPLVGLAYSDAFLAHRNLEGGHVERPARLSAVTKALREAGAWDAMAQIVPRPATDAELAAVHTRGYLRKLARLESRLEGEDEGQHRERLVQAGRDAEDVFFNEHTVRCARLAAGAAMEAVRAVCGGAADSALALVRPPGHHAERHCAQGFCVLNNVAVAARFALDALGLKRVLVVDWDIHHGNGTQASFLDEPRVLYFSAHRFDFGKFYPAQSSAGAHVVGTKLGAGANVNVAWNGKGMGDREYLAAWERVLMPIAGEFQPELVIVSAGFDAARGDAMGGCDVTPEGYAALLEQLRTLAGGRVVMVLEGGYDLKALASSLTACVATLMAQRETANAEYAARMAAQPVKPAAVEAIEATRKAHKPFWSFKVAGP